MYNKFSYVSFMKINIKLKLKNLIKVNKIELKKNHINLLVSFSSLHKFKEHTSYVNVNTLIGIKLCFKKYQNVKCFLIFNCMK